MSRKIWLCTFALASVLTLYTSPSHAQPCGISTFSCFPDGFANSVTVSWDPVPSATSIEVSVNGLVVAPLPGSATSHTIQLTHGGFYEFGLSAICPQGPTPMVTCSLDLAGCLSPSVDCAVVGDEVHVSWTAPYNIWDFVSLFRDGILIATLPGTVTSYVDDPGYSGHLFYEVHAACSFGSSGSGACYATVPCAEVTGLTCMPTPQGEILVHWDPASVDQLTIYRNGAFYAIVPGTETAFLDASPAAATADGTSVEYEVVAHCAGVPGPASSCTAPIGAPFRRGDSNQDGVFNLADIVTLLGSIFGAETLECHRTGDVNRDNGVNIADAIYGLNYLFAGGPPPPTPFEECGRDDASTVDCVSYDAPCQ